MHVSVIPRFLKIARIIPLEILTYHTLNSYSTAHNNERYLKMPWNFVLLLSDSDIIVNMGSLVDILLRGKGGEDTLSEGLYQPCITKRQNTYVYACSDCN